MRVNQLLEALPKEAQFEYRGDREADFRGLEVRSRNGSVRERLYVFPDEHWPVGTRSRFRESRRGSIEARVAEAAERGATGFVVPRKACGPELLGLLAGKNCFIVDDTHAFAWLIVDAMRKEFDTCAITAVTGAAGKSTTQEMIAHALRSLSLGRIFAPGNNQNMYESAVWQLTRIERPVHAVLEVSGTAAHRIVRQGQNLGADVSVITAIAEAHLQSNEGLEDVAERKAAIFSGPPPAGTAVINLDTPYSDLLIRRAFEAGRQVITYGESPQAAVRLTRYDPATLRATAKVGKDTISYRLGAPGKHMAINSLAVIAVLRAHRIAQWRRGVVSLARFRALEGRGEQRETTFGSSRVVLIDESYNANPASVRAALETLSTTQFASGQRKVAILGDMLEMGERSSEAHMSLAPSVEAAGLDAVLLFGEEMRALKEALPGNDARYHYWPSLEAMSAELPELLAEGDVVLAKASHGTGLMDWLKSRDRTVGR